jgi:cysteine desulfurase family protein (TIGR01976 family)
VPAVGGTCPQVWVARRAAPQYYRIAVNNFPIEWVRSVFPALNSGDGFIFFDNAAGAQVPQGVLDAVNDHLLSRNVQRGGRYRQSREVDALLDRARQTVAIFLNACDPNEVAFGMNATSFMRLVSLGIGQMLQERNQIIVTDLDHESNIATWLALAREGAQILWWRLRDDGRLYPEDLDPLLGPKTRLIACPIASNAIGTIVDVAGVARRAHAAGAEVFLDAVHYGPHGPMDVQAFGCDYLTCSGYKIFAPHMGFLWGRREALRALPTFREDFIPDQPPAKIEVGTYVYENVAGMAAAIDYLEGLGARVASNGSGNSRRAGIVGAMEAIRAYEARLSAEILREFATIHEVTVYGIHAPEAVAGRVPTVCFNIRGVSPAEVTEDLAAREIGVRDGHMYSPRLMKRLGLSESSGAVRASLVHYNSMQEVGRFIEAIREIAAGHRSGNPSTKHPS